MGSHLFLAGKGNIDRHKMAGHEYGRTMKYQYSIAGKVLNFPWKFHWKHGRGVRFTAYAILASMPVFYQLHKVVNSPGNVEQWKQIRAARHHDRFARPTEHGGHH